jgi:hypothetical protein
VYHGKLLPELGGKEVAVKVQRPGVLEGAALDIYVMRRALQIYCKLPGVSEHLPSRIPAGCVSQTAACWQSFAGMSRCVIIAVVRGVQ